MGLDCAEGALGGEGVWGEGNGDLGYDWDVEEFGQADAVGGYVFVFVLGVLEGMFGLGRWWDDDGRTFNVDGWRVAAGLHYAAEEDRDVAGHYFVSCCLLYRRYGSNGLRDVALLEYWRVLR